MGTMDIGYIYKTQNRRVVVAIHHHTAVGASALPMEGGDVCSHDHDCGGEDCGGSSLHGYVDHPRVTVLNAEDDAAAPRVLRPWCVESTKVPPICVVPNTSAP